jgi:hypothetical protein
MPGFPAVALPRPRAGPYSSERFLASSAISVDRRRMAEPPLYKLSLWKRK